MDSDAGHELIAVGLLLSGRLAPHLHAAARGAIPRAILKRVVEATYYTLWWPPFDQPIYVDRIPVWTGPEHGYADPDTGEILPTWDQALDRINNDPDPRPAHVMGFGTQLDLQGVIPEQADQAVRYLTKYLTKAIGETYADDTDQAYQRHINRLHAELRWLPCSPRCANWLRYGVQPDHPGPNRIPGHCRQEAHDRDNLGITRRVLPSRLWSGKTVEQHKADRAQVVRETLLAAGIDDLDLDRMAASVTLADGSPRFVDRCPARPRPTSRSSSTRSANGNAGAASMNKPRPSPARGLPGLPAKFRQLRSRRDRTALPRPEQTSASPDDRPALGRRNGSQG